MAVPPLSSCLQQLHAFKITMQRLAFAIFLDARRRKSNSIMCAHIAQFICATSCLQSTCLLHLVVCCCCCCCNNYILPLLRLLGAIWQFCEFIFLFAYPTTVALSNNTGCLFSDRSFELSLLRDFLLSFCCLNSRLYSPCLLT